MSVAYRIRELIAKTGIGALKASGFYDGYWKHWRGPIFDYAEARGLHILPVHYYSPIPNMSAPLHARSNFPVDVEASAARLNQLVTRYDDELEKLFNKPGKTPVDYDPNNASYGPIDAATLYGYVRDTRPKRIIEIGSGASTLVTAAAIRANQAEDASYEPKFTCIEPYLPPYLRAGVLGVSQLIEKPLQDIPLETFTALESGDILFIDSTHVVNFGSDVLYEYLTILPSLAQGVLIHVHDIFLPGDYPWQWLKEYRFFWNEQYLLEAFLTMNQSYAVELAVNAGSKKLEPAKSIASHPSNVLPAGFWIRRI